MLQAWVPTILKLCKLLEKLGNGQQATYTARSIRAAKGQAVGTFEIIPHDSSLQLNLGIINLELQFLKLTAPEVLWAFLGYAFLGLHAKRS